MTKATAATAALPWGDVNVVVLTDTHSWVAGHGRHEPGFNADYGDVVSFYRHLQSQTPQGSDLFFVMNGDCVQGTGLSESLTPTGLTNILQRMPWDALNIGNHELYEAETIDFLYNQQPRSFVQHWNGTYLTSNVVSSETRTPLGSRYTLLRGAHSTLLTFGFLYNMQNANKRVVVETVQETVSSDWFVSALRDQDFSAILVLAHMDFQDALVQVLLQAMREIVGADMPIQFITGHSHIRGYTVLDEQSVSFEAGRYLDTVGFCSFPHMDSAQNEFQHVFLDAQVENLQATLGIDNMTTAEGAALSRLIHDTQEEMGLLDVVGCTDESYYLLNGLEEPHSLWGLYRDKIVPFWLKSEVQYSIVVQHFGELRYDLLEGNITMDDVISVTPFDLPYYLIGRKLKGSLLAKVLNHNGYGMNQIEAGSTKRLPEDVVSGATHLLADEVYHFYTTQDKVQDWTERIANVTGKPYDFVPTPVYTKEGVALTTVGLWKEFVQTHMPQCDGGLDGNNSSPGAFFYVAMALAGMLVGMGWTKYRTACRRTKAGYLEPLEGVVDSAIVV